MDLNRPRRVMGLEDGVTCVEGNCSTSRLLGGCEILLMKLQGVV